MGSAPLLHSWLSPDVVLLRNNWSVSAFSALSGDQVKQSPWLLIQSSYQPVMLQSFRYGTTCHSGPVFSLQADASLTRTLLTPCPSHRKTVLTDQVRGLLPRQSG